MSNCDKWNQIVTSGTKVFNFIQFSIEGFHHRRGLFVLLAVATGFYMLKSSKLGKLTSEILNDLQLIVRS